MVDACNNGDVGLVPPVDRSHAAPAATMCHNPGKVIVAIILFPFTLIISIFSLLFLLIFLPCCSMRSGPFWWTYDYMFTLPNKLTIWGCFCTLDCLCGLCEIEH